MKILFATDGSNDARKAQKLCLHLMKSGVHKAVLLSVIESNPWLAALERHAQIGPTVTEECVMMARNFLDVERQAFDVSGWDVNIARREGHVVQELCDESDLQSSDLIVVGAHGHTRFMDYLLGGVSDKLIKHVRSSVLIVRGVEDEIPEAGDEEPIRILLAHDGSDTIDRSIEVLRQMELRRPLDITLVRVLELVEPFNVDAIQHTSTDWDQDVEEARVDLKMTKKKLEGLAQNVNIELHEGGDVSNELLKTSLQMQPDLVVVGHRGRSAIQTFLLGSVAYRVAVHATGSVLIVK